MRSIIATTLLLATATAVTPAAGAWRAPRVKRGGDVTSSLTAACTRSSPLASDIPNTYPAAVAKAKRRGDYTQLLDGYARFLSSCPTKAAISAVEPCTPADDPACCFLTSDNGNAVKCPISNWGVPVDYLRTLTEFLAVHPPTLDLTLEIGCACGTSAVHFVAAHAKRGTGLHINVEPSPEGFKFAPFAAFDRHNLARYSRGIKGFSNYVVPALAGEYGAHSFDVIFIDGHHGFGETVLDLVNADQLLKVGGYLLLDDVQTGWPGVQKARTYFERHYQNYKLEPACTLPTRVPCWQKVGVTNHSNQSEFYEF